MKTHSTFNISFWLYLMCKEIRLFHMFPERSPDKKSPTVSLPSYNVAVSNERATRPLPPPPERHSYTDKPWFHNVSREQAAALIKDRMYSSRMFLIKIVSLFLLYYYVISIEKCLIS